MPVEENIMGNGRFAQKYATECNWLVSMRSTICLLASWRLLMTFANDLDPDEVLQSICDPKCLTL